jgi:hypothetical protein
MLAKMFRRFWMHVLIAFFENYTIEGFKKTGEKFDLPDNLMQMDPATKRKFTICNLFANQNLSIKDICVVLDASKHLVVDTLIEQNLIKERRRKRKELVKKHGSLSITPDETTEESTDSDSSQDLKDTKKPDDKTESNIHEEPKKTIATAGNVSRAEVDPTASRRIA